MTVIEQAHALLEKDRGARAKEAAKAAAAVAKTTETVLATLAEAGWTNVTPVVNEDNTTVIELSLLTHPVRITVTRSGEAWVCTSSYGRIGRRHFSGINRTVGPKSELRNTLVEIAYALMDAGTEET